MWKAIDWWSTNTDQEARRKEFHENVTSDCPTSGVLQMQSSHQHEEALYRRAYKHCVGFDILKELPLPLRIPSSIAPGYACSGSTTALECYSMAYVSKEWLPYLVSITVNYKRVSDGLVIRTRVLLPTVWLYVHSNPGYENHQNRGSSNMTLRWAILQGREVVLTAHSL